MKHHPVKQTVVHPFWFRASMTLVGLSLLFVILSYGKFILMPLAFAAFLSMLLSPIVNKLEQWKLGRAFSIIITILLVLIVLAGVISLISAQFVQFAERVPEVTQRLKSVTTDGISFLEETVGLSQEQRSNYLEQGLSNVIDKSGSYISSILSATTSTFTLMSLLPIFIFFMLYYREMYIRFFQKLFSRDGGTDGIDEVMENVQEVTQNYLVGMLTVIGILAVLNTSGLLIIGLDHAIFFGVFASLMAVIPYIGIIIGALPPLLFALLLGDSLLQPVFVIAVFGTVQFLEGNFITPRIVGSKVSINPFMAMLALIVGGEIWGISGMILFVPLIGILRVIFQEIEELKPYGYLLGNTIEYEE
ncbi:MAG TPA: AI-2E family transporter [Balneolaceae bacterium]|nr:AI-2E family transporter [Balneolaceae bacterium]|tara:strand:+ start:161577 stop:162659 length:1083 start_codon:yes stop_codon:yes gene_type:complete